ncbi:hypothetical protein C9374_013274 [Naegleria lovaniensis]|uniref:Maltose/galactoside acetyltransferase domain-containing protein n=1 Tax=Naegleria lovaniensis TaxID=51637 RepID=A0AA88H0Z2_NAELO|nr:uncharacterized protein C9374_013274 [Naegleria lovaniensis]KAG2391789.1 hypothetical protein C9374_013274 [Naegleria lovaniensis]
MNPQQHQQQETTSQVAKPTSEQWQRMLAGEMYNAMDPSLVQARRQCRQEFLHPFNNLSEQQESPSEFREALCRTFMGHHGENSYIEPPFRCDYGSNIYYGKNFYANFNCCMLDVCEIRIGENVMFGPNVQIYTATHPTDPIERTQSGMEYGKPITIGDYVWIGGGAIVNPGVTIGEGSTIGSGSVVTRDVPPYVVAAGNPCRVIKQLERPKIKETME